MPHTILHVWDTRKNRETVSLLKDSLLLEKETIYEKRTRERGLRAGGDKGSREQGGLLGWGLGQGMPRRQVSGGEHLTQKNVAPRISPCISKSVEYISKGATTLRAGAGISHKRQGDPTKGTRDYMQLTRRGRQPWQHPCQPRELGFYVTGQ